MIARRVPGQPGDDILGDRQRGNGDAPFAQGAPPPPPPEAPIPDNGGVDPSRGTETPRERPNVNLRGGAAPPTPMSPSPVEQGVPNIPAFQPMPPAPTPGLPGLSSPRRRGLFGEQGGLTGGGLGVPGNNPASPVDISALIKSLMQGFK